MLLCSTLPFVFVARHSFSFNSVIEQTSKLIMSSSCSSPSSSSNSIDPKLKTRIRRVKANGRERARMLGLNNALDVLREYIPITTQHQKLSKIETLRLAKNYIEALNRMLTTNSQPTPLEYAHQLANGLSQTTTNMLANLLQVQPRLLLPTSQFESFIDLPYSESTNSSPSNTTICSPQQYFYSSNLPSAAPLTTNPTIFDTAASSPTSTTSPHQRLQYPIHHHHQQQQYFHQFSS